MNLFISVTFLLVCYVDAVATYTLQRDLHVTRCIFTGYSVSSRLLYLSITVEIFEGYRCNGGVTILTYLSYFYLEIMCQCVWVCLCVCALTVTVSVLLFSV